MQTQECNKRKILGNSNTKTINKKNIYIKQASKQASKKTNNQ